MAGRRRQLATFQPANFDLNMQMKLPIMQMSMQMSWNGPPFRAVDGARLVTSTTPRQLAQRQYLNQLN